MSKVDITYSPELLPAVPDDVLIIVPVRNLVMFPGVMMPMQVGREFSIAGIEEAFDNKRRIGLLMQRDPDVEKPGIDDLHTIGTSATILRYASNPQGDTYHVISQGEQRFRILELIEGNPFMLARVDYIRESDEMSTEIEARVHRLKTLALEGLELLPTAPMELSNAIQSITSPSDLTDIVASFIDIEADDKQDILETLDLKKRLNKVIKHVSHRVEVLRISNNIHEKTQEKITDRQREFMLREQMEEIKKELGEDEGSEIEEIEIAIANAEMPEHAEEQALKELRRLERMSEASSEYSMSRTYLDWLVELPWSKLDEEQIDIEAAAKILDEDHYGLSKIKKRILEYLAVRKLNPDGRSPILCFVGPPGVGKTSLGKSIARAIGLEFIRASLGGIHDESEIRGHRRTYVGAMPGKIIQNLRKAGTRNPIFMLDEMDKLSSSYQGDPSSALLEVLDPQQNTTFEDNYLGLPFDLSKVMFISTANALHQIPGPLRDRMEVIELNGYTAEEKYNIAKKYLVKRQIKQNGLKASQVTLTAKALKKIIEGYTREAGCRGLERQIGSVFRSAAVKVAQGETKKIKIDVDDLHEILGAQKFESELAMRTGVPGVATGLAWTPVGGDILFIEATKTPGKGGLILTGQLGSVMKESAQAAFTLVKSRYEELGIDKEILQKNDIHVHVPAGAIPKDGPSAGVAMFLALVSLLKDKKIKKDVAMTGEISLRGLVLPIGGLKEKCIAAARAGIKTVLIPKRNERDIEEIPESARKKLKFVVLENVDEALEIALG
ncbi:MAG: endopeptidase La [Gammaproteobacteria bacterium]